jgi:hypothetical protein
MGVWEFNYKLITCTNKLYSHTPILVLKHIIPQTYIIQSSHLGISDCISIIVI